MPRWNEFLLVKTWHKWLVVANQNALFQHNYSTIKFVYDVDSVE